MEFFQDVWKIYIKRGIHKYAAKPGVTFWKLSASVKYQQNFVNPKKIYEKILRVTVIIAKNSNE